MADARLQTAKPRRSFYDREVQAIIWQVVVVALFIALVWFLARNTVINLEKRSIQTGFGFLSREAGFEIGESLIRYSPANSYGYAILVGFLNTMQVSIIGIVLTTLLGIVVGVATLSKNWLMAKLAAGYIHVLRNIPVLLQIIAWYAILQSDRFLPNPRQAKPVLDTFFTQRGIYFPIPEYHIGWMAVLAGLVIGAFGAVALGKWAAKRQADTGEQFPTFWGGLGLILGIPFVLWLVFGAPTTMNMPQLRGFNITGGAHISPEFIAILVGLTIYTSAFIADIVRSGILAVHKGQTEAGRALGLRESVIMNRIVLPQALRVIIPPLTSQYLNLTKNSTLSVAIGYPDLFNVTNTAINQTGQAVEGILILMIVFLTVSLVTAAAMNWYNDRMELVER